MSDERDAYGRIIDAAERYQHFMLGLFGTLTEAGDEGYSQPAVEKLKEARDLFMADFEARFPGFGKGRAVWLNSATELA